MADRIEKLEKLVEDQNKQIQTLKQALMRVQQQLGAVNVVANRAQGQTRRVTEEIRSIQHKMRKG